MNESLISRCDALAERIVLPGFTVSREDFLNTPLPHLTRTLDQEPRLAISILSALMLFVTRHERAGPHGAVQDPTLKGVYRLIGTGGLLRPELPFEARTVDTEVPLAMFSQLREIARAGACGGESLERQVEWGQVEATMNEAIALRDDQRAMVVSIIRCVLERRVEGGLRAPERSQGPCMPVGISCPAAGRQPRRNKRSAGLNNVSGVSG